MQLLETFSPKIALECFRFQRVMFLHTQRDQAKEKIMRKEKKFNKSGDKACACEPVSFESLLMGLCQPDDTPHVALCVFYCVTHFFCWLIEYRPDAAGRISCHHQSTPTTRRFRFQITSTRGFALGARLAPRFSAQQPRRAARGLVVGRAASAASLPVRVQENAHPFNSSAPRPPVFSVISGPG